MCHINNSRAISADRDSEYFHPFPSGGCKFLSSVFLNFAGPIGGPRIWSEVYCKASVLRRGGWKAPRVWLVHSRDVTGVLFYVLTADTSRSGSNIWVARVKRNPLLRVIDLNIGRVALIMGGGVHLALPDFFVSSLRLVFFSPSTTAIGD